MRLAGRISTRQALPSGFNGSAYGPCRREISSARSSPPFSGVGCGRAVRGPCTSVRPSTTLSGRAQTTARRGRAALGGTGRISGAITGGLRLKGPSSPCPVRTHASPSVAAIGTTAAPSRASGRSLAGSAAVRSRRCHRRV